MKVAQLYKSVVFAAVLLAPVALAAEGAVGTIAVVEGSAFRTPAKGGGKVALKVGSEIEIKDVIETSDPGNLKITLNDKSTILLGKGSKLTIKEAAFKDQVRESFDAELSFGSVWSKVSKALTGGDAKFEISTTRAVAGVRGTVFRVDAAKLIRGTTTGPKAATGMVIKVSEGRVAIAPKPEGFIAAAPAKPTPAPKVGGPRVQIAKVAEVTKEAWEKRFVELQANSMVNVDSDWTAAAWTPADDKDDFAKFIASNGGGLP